MASEAWQEVVTMILQHSKDSLIEEVDSEMHATAHC